MSDKSTPISCELEEDEFISPKEELVTLVRDDDVAQIHGQGLGDGQLLIEVSRLSGDSLHLLVPPSTTILDMKKVVAEAENVPVELLHFTRVGSGECLTNAYTIEECELTTGSKLLLIKKKASAPEIIESMSYTPTMILGNGRNGGKDDNLYCPRGRPAFVPTHPHLLVVVDNCNHRIKVNDVRTGRLLCSIGKSGRKGAGEGEFFYPHGAVVTKDGKFVVVADKDNCRLQVLSLSVADDGASARLTFVRFIGKELTPDGTFYPVGVAMRPDGTVVVADMCKNARVLEFSLDGTLVKSFAVNYGPGGQGDLAVLDSGEVALADEKNHRVQLFDTEGVLIRMFGKFGSNDGQFQFPSTLAADDYGNLMILDKDTSRLQVFDAEGQHLCTRIHPLMHHGWYKGIAWDAVGGLAIQNSMDHNALIWSNLLR